MAGDFRTELRPPFHHSRRHYPQRRLWLSPGLPNACGRQLGTLGLESTFGAEIHRSLSTTAHHPGFAPGGNSPRTEGRLVSHTRTRQRRVVHRSAILRGPVGSRRSRDGAGAQGATGVGEMIGAPANIQRAAQTRYNSVLAETLTGVI